MTFVLFSDIDNGGRNRGIGGGCSWWNGYGKLNRVCRRVSGKPCTTTIYCASVYCTCWVATTLNAGAKLLIYNYYISAWGNI